ncbi:hypothetical protein [Bifidobacterium aquikefiri]|jgi:hypothetical protein|uniref:Transposase n=1 Tax=Bifidobacterium psychraerophilum TaxID=218140 RepID=A0A087CIW8_9BIFI|nr:hypothetical protein BPSY_0311 [Bifidobacterium psychraerophilum]
MPRAYQPKFLHRAVQMLGKASPASETEFEAIRHVASNPGVSQKTLRT